MRTYRKFRFQAYPYPYWLPEWVDAPPMPHVGGEHFPTISAFVGEMIKEGGRSYEFDKQRAWLIEEAYHDHVREGSKDNPENCDANFEDEDGSTTSPSLVYSDDLLGELIQNFAKAIGVRVRKPSDYTWENLLHDAAHWYYHVSAEDFIEQRRKLFLPREVIKRYFKRVSPGAANPDIVRTLKRADAEIYAVLARREWNQMVSLEPYGYMKTINGFLFGRTRGETDEEFYERVLSAEHVKSIYEAITNNYASKSADLAVDMLLDLGAVYKQLKPANYVDLAIAMGRIEDFLWKYYVQPGSEFPDDEERATDRCRLASNDLLRLAYSSDTPHMFVEKVDNGVLRGIASALALAGIRLNCKDKNFQFRVAAIYDVLWRELILKRRDGQ